MTNKFLEYAKQNGANTEVIEWVETVLRSAEKKETLDTTEVEHILDYLVSADAPARLRRMSYAQAKSNADKWTKSQQKKGADIIENDNDIADFITFDDGFKVVELKSENAYKREGFLMRHCLGSYALDSTRKIYSLRDEKNMPHATIEIKSANSEINQIKGKGNGSIHPKYIVKILDTLEKLGKSIRPSEMTNLGYTHVPKNALDLVELIGLQHELVKIKNENYCLNN